MEQLNTQLINNDIQQFMAIFKKKGKLKYRWYKKGMSNIAKKISPAYRDFVNKVFSNGKLKIKYDGRGYCESSYETSIDLSKRANTTIAIDYWDCDTFLHELGHSVDFLFGRQRALSSSVIVQNGKTLRQIFDEEFKEHHKEIREFIMNEYRLNINSNIHSGAYDIFINNMPKYLTLCECKDKKERKKLQNELYQCGFVEVYYQIATKKCFDTLNRKFGSMLDALSAIYPIEGTYLTGHEKGYYQLDPNRPVYEFFANTFADKLMGDHCKYDQLIKLMPKSFNAFERLFVLIYDHIQNNKRFKDLPLIPYGEEDDEELEEETKPEEVQA